MNDLTRDFLKSEFGNSFYKELYHLKNSEHTVVLEESTGKLLLRKILKYYDIRVFEYLKANHHINIPSIIDFYQHNDELIVFEEFIQGVTLDDYLTDNHKEAELNKIINDVFDAVYFIHNAKPAIIHRDIKSSNIIISNDGVAKLIDFDAAKCFNPNSSQDTVLLGTEGFAAPEQYGFGSSDVRTDIYGLGKLIESVFQNRHRYNNIIKKATHIDPNKRFSSVMVLKRVFNNGLILLPFPGFRNSDPTHILLSTVGYALLVVLLFNCTFKGFSIVGTRFTQIMLFLLAVLWIDMYSGVSPLFTRIFLTSSDNSLVRFFGCLLYSFISLIMTLFLIATVILIFNL